MVFERLPSWLRTLGYSTEGKAIHLRDEAIDSAHAYAAELHDLLRPDGHIRAHAVFDVDGSPAVAFFEDDGTLLTAEGKFDRIRQRIWNQNLISIVMVVNDTGLTAYPLPKRLKPAPTLKASQATLFGFFSAAEICSGEIQQRLPNWFKPEACVDRQLLKNLTETVTLLQSTGHTRDVAQTLMGQVLFISYLEHRGIVSDIYRSHQRVGSLHDLIAARDIKGIQKLLTKLRGSFNGDFLSIDPDLGDLWGHVDDAAFPILDSFLKRVDMTTGQQSFWNYDFSFIPVELLSGIYESFIGDEKHAMGAYYTPRPLANLLIEQAFAYSKDPLQEYIYDGACGSGILLTTAFRRMIGLAEARHGKQMMLRDRIDLLQERIFGSDLNKSACKVTAFSLYLSLLEHLEPSDVLALQQNEQVKLPSLQGKNLVSGLEKGDFFSPLNPLASQRKYTLLLSNPPWGEPKRDVVTSADNWAKDKPGVTRVRRQIAGDFAFRAADCLVEGGRMCLIMPASLFLAPTSQEFVSGWLARNRIHQLINFGDFMNFIFEKAEHSCAVVHASPRAAGQGIPAEEMIDYWVPKVDTSVAFGRLTLASGDRHAVQAQAYFTDCSRLVTLMWGNEADLALLTRLQWLGTFKEMMVGPTPRWVRRKGFHRHDAAVKEPVSAKPLRKYPYVDIEALKRGLPIVLTADLAKLPAEIKEVPKISDALLRVFKGPRIIFPDGFDSALEMRASFINVPATFTSSVGVIAGPESDADLLRFAAVYLRSDLIKYFFLMSVYQVACDRNTVRLTNIDDFSFITPESHSSEKEARAILKKVSALVSRLDDGKLLRVDNAFEAIRDELNELVFDYFGLTKSERALIKEAVSDLVPSVRPRGYASIYTRIQQRTDKSQVTAYVNALKSELNDWQRQLGGEGEIFVQATVMDFRQAGPFGIVRVSLDTKADSDRAKVVCDDNAVNALLVQLRLLNLLPMRITEELYFAADTMIWSENSLYLIRPLIRRHWLRRTAIRDARRIVSDLHLPSLKETA